MSMGDHPEYVLSQINHDLRDEIERLTAENKRLRDENAKLRGNLQAAVDDPSDW